MIPRHAAKIACLLAIILPATAVAQTAAPARYIPLQLILGERWDGTPTITYPTLRAAEAASRGASVWEGPKDWTHPKTGRTLKVYFRSRDGRNAAEQYFAVRDDKTAIGRVADSRFGITACDQEGKYPLGLWRQGETRTFESTCWYGDKLRQKVSTITIQEIDYSHEGIAHSLRLEWIHRDVGRDGPPTDRRIYIFAPDRGMIRQWQVK